jgi:hypothetical protein
MLKQKGTLLAAVALVGGFAIGPVAAQDAPAKPYSPYVDVDHSTNVYFGDTHLHTSFSADAGLAGNRLGIAEAYRFARGEKVTSSTGLPAQLSRPLDFLVVADHSDGMGFVRDLIAGAPHIVAEPLGKEWHDRINKGPQEMMLVARDLIGRFSQGTIPKELIYGPDTPAYRDAWKITVDTAEEYNDPGKFTAFIGYEWTSLIKGNNLHRVVIYRDDKDVVGDTVPYTTTPPAGSRNPRDLWKWLANYEATTGGQIIALAHNGNLSNGIMFPVDAQYDGLALDDEYVTMRGKWEPLYEASQIKGDGEAHPFLSPDDGFADFETWDVGNLDQSEAKTDEMLAGDYAREALKNGLKLEADLGTNPYKFGMIGSTDSHTSLATAQEDNFFSKFGRVEPAATRMDGQIGTATGSPLAGWAYNAAGLAAVWAKDNTRAALFDAMERKEVYATTGSRLRVRFFGGWDFSDADFAPANFPGSGYAKGVPMGGDLSSQPDGVSGPTFLVSALRDTQGANLDRIQIVKGWLDASGETQEKVYDAAWSSDRAPDAAGVLPAVGNSVDAATATYTNTIGAAELTVAWSDPDFDPAQRAFYYARVLEIPTPRWSTFDAVRFGREIPEGAPVSTQDRAYTSPIWYTPAQ